MIRKLRKNNSYDFDDFWLDFSNSEECFPKTTAQAICMYLSNAWTLTGRDKDKLFHLHTNDLWIIIKLFPFEWKSKKMYSVFGAFFMHYSTLQITGHISRQILLFAHIQQPRKPGIKLVMYTEVVFCVFFFFGIKSSFLMCSLQSLIRGQIKARANEWKIFLMKSNVTVWACRKLGKNQI